MNGVHDMGGMHGMGPVQYENNEPVFHARWEGRVTHSIARWRLGKMEHRYRPLPARADPSGRLPAHELLRKMVHRLRIAVGEAASRRGLRSKWAAGARIAQGDSCA